MEHVCQNFIDTNYNTIVCTGCGLETRIEVECTRKNVGYIMSHSPFQFGYSRVKRFSNMLHSLFFPSATALDNKMVKHLYFHKEKIHSRKDLNFYINTSCLRDKRFCTMHFFCKTFLNNYMTPPCYGNTFACIKRMSFLFERIALAFSRMYPEKPFINYNFLMRYILQHCSFCYYLRFVKKLKCVKRKRSYTSLLKNLGFTPYVNI